MTLAQILAVAALTVPVDGYLAVVAHRYRVRLHQLDATVHAVHDLDHARRVAAYERTVFRPWRGGAR